MKITTTKHFDKQFKKQTPKVKQAFVKRIQLFLTEPDHLQLNVHRLSGNHKDVWSFNVSGDVRVIFDRSFEGLIILEAIGSHSELYG